jgi:hypothetical protein
MYNNRQIYHSDCHEFIVIFGFSISDWKKDVNWKAIDPDCPDDNEEDFAREDARPAGKSQFYIVCYPGQKELNRMVNSEKINNDIIHHQTCLHTLQLS